MAFSEIRTFLFVFLNGQIFTLKISNSIGFVPEACSSRDSIVTIAIGLLFRLLTKERCDDAGGTCGDCCCRRGPLRFR